MSKANYFYCLMKCRKCRRNFLGIKACKTCNINGLCSVCGRHQTTFCEKCVNRKDGKDGEI